MTRAFVLGNGLSRQGVNLEQLSRLGKIYGCNALYRDFVPDVLVATDRPIAESIQKSGYALANRFYTRRPIEGLGGRELVEKYSGFSSGPNAVALSALDDNYKIYLLGFDMGPTEENLFNNVYSNTEFYKTSQHPPTFTGNWAKQLAQISRDFYDREFIRVFGKTTAQISQLENLNNFKNLSLQDFLDRINNGKDL
jgi:hypothetical protein